MQLGFPLLGEVRLWWHLSSQGQQGQLRQQEGAEACRPPPSRHPKPSDLCRESLSLPWEMLRHPLPAAAPGLAGDLCDSPLPIWWSLSPVAHDRPQVSEQQLLKDRTEKAWQSYFMVKCAEVPGGAAQGCSTRLRTRFQRGRPKSRNSPHLPGPGSTMPSSTQEGTLATAGHRAGAAQQPSPCTAASTKSPGKGVPQRHFPRKVMR